MRGILSLRRKGSNRTFSNIFGIINIACMVLSVWIVDVSCMNIQLLLGTRRHRGGEWSEVLYFGPWACHCRIMVFPPQSVLRREREYTNTTHTLYRRCLSLHPSRDPWSVDRRWYINVNPSSGFPPYELRGHCEVTSVTPPPSAWHNVRQYGFESALLFLLYQGLYVGPHEEEEDTVRVNSLIANESSRTYYDKPWLLTT